MSLEGVILLRPNCGAKSCLPATQNTKQNSSKCISNNKDNSSQSGYIMLQEAAIYTKNISFAMAENLHSNSQTKESPDDGCYINTFL